MSFESKRIVIIGGTSGIGYAVAEAAVRDGAHVVVASSNPEKVDSAVKRLSNGVTGAVIDVTSESAVEAAFAKIGPLDHLVTTAGDWKARRGPVGEMDLDAASGTLRFASGVRWRRSSMPKNTSLRADRSRSPMEWLRIARAKARLSRQRWRARSNT